MKADTAGYYWRGTNEGWEVKNINRSFFLPPNHDANHENCFNVRGAGNRTCHDFGFFKVHKTWWTSFSFGNNYFLTRMVSWRT